MIWSTASVLMNLNPNTLIAVSAYDGDRHQVETNLPCYYHHECPVIVLSPRDGAITDLGDKRIKCITAGEKGWIGPHTLLRQREFLRILSGQSADFFLFNDADSVCMSEKIPEYLYSSPDVFWSNEVLDTNPAASRLPKIAMQPPYFFSRDTLRKLIRSAATPALSFTQPSPEGWPMPTPTDCIDHWMLQIVYAAGVFHKSFPDGASFETTSEHGLKTMRYHVGNQGKIFIHQIKTQKVLDTLLLDRKFYLENHK